MNYTCCGENRKAAIRGNASLNLNGIDYLEVLDYNTLVVHCLRAAPSGLTAANIIIDGGESITGVGAQWVSAAAPPPPLATSQEQSYFAALPDAANVLVIRTTRVGDFSSYTLRLVNPVLQAQEEPFDITSVLSGFDPQLAQVEFSFRAECGTDFDCQPQPASCPPPAITPPPINYLAKDYGSFRTAMLDRMNQLLPNWAATSEADLGVALAELIAYAGDQLSYRQDAIATEAYLETARSRVSLRRHALLVDHRVHDGCNARVWMHIQIEVNGPLLLDRNHAVFATYAAGMPPVLANNENAVLLAGAQLFQPMHSKVLLFEHNQMSFYTWGETDCCLPIGATEATLTGNFYNLEAGDVLIFQEVLGPQTGVAGDADIRHRYAVRLTQVTAINGINPRLTDPLSGQGITQIQWSAADAPTFPVCLSSSFLDADGKRQSITDVTVVLGNIVLADQGLSVSGIEIGAVPPPRLFYPPNVSADRCLPSRPVPLPVRFRPTLPDNPITQAAAISEIGNVAVLNPDTLVSLTDPSGVVTLQIATKDVFQWPGYFTVLTKANATQPANFDLSVVYNGADSPAGLGPVVIETLANLSLQPADPNYAPNQINRLSKFLAVPTSYLPPPTAPSGFPAAPVALPNTGTVDLKDSNGVAFLTVQATDPTAWVSSFGVVAHGVHQGPGIFNLSVVYARFFTADLPLIVEHYSSVSLANIATQINSPSCLISVKGIANTSPSPSAYDLMHFNPGTAVPEITLQGTLNGVATTWTPRQDLLEEEPASPSFVVEVESNGLATVRFGDNTNGRTPDTNTSFVASYRLGNGSAGNVGAERLIYFAATPGVLACTNPLPAFGGVDPETNEQIRRRAPQAFQTQERAITMSDYQNVAEASPQVNQAVATVRWTGSWYTVFLAAEPRGAGMLSTALEKSLQKNIERYRLAGQDLQLQSPQYVSLEIELQVRVDPNYFRGHVKQSLLAILGNGILPDGQKGLFYPASFTLGQTVYLSPIYAAARSVAGVLSVTANKFQPQGVNTTQYLNAGEIKLGSFQVARLENDPSLPDHGQLTLVMEGGK